MESNIELFPQPLIPTIKQIFPFFAPNGLIITDEAPLDLISFLPSCENLKRSSGIFYEPSPLNNDFSFKNSKSAGVYLLKFEVVVSGGQEKQTNKFECL